MPDDRSSPLDHLPCGVLETSEHGVIARANRTFSSWLGYQPDELVGRRFQDLLTVGCKMFHHTHWAPLLRMQGSVSEVKLELVHRDGTTVPMVLNAVRQADLGNIVHQIAAYVARDRDRYERELLHSRRRLEELVAETQRLHAESNDRAVAAEQMVGIVSHDLRNPLATIQMATHLLDRDAMAPDQRLIVERIDRAIQRATNLVGDLLDFTQAKLGSGLSVSLETIGLHAVVAEVIEDLRSRYPARSLIHVRRGDRDCIADPARLAQAIGNLVSNAFTYGDRTSAVTVTSTNDTIGSSISVHNLGSVIPVDVAAQIFAPMTRGSTAGAKNRSIGLGLFIVQEIAKAHGGEASVTSTVETGTELTVAWPRRDQ